MLASLDHAVIEAVGFFCDVDENLSDGHQTAHEVLSHLVYWHREYARIISALAEHRQPELKSGTFAELNAQAYQEFQTYSTLELADCLMYFQEELVEYLQRLTYWRMDFPVKQGGRFLSVEDRIPDIEAHIHNHVQRLRKAARKVQNDVHLRKAS
jgi:hypothetical protein